MKRVYLFPTLVSIIIAALNNKAIAQGIKNEATSQDIKSEVYNEPVRQLPQFPGGDMALMKYIGENLQYPIEAYQNGKQGKVVVQFFITETGDIGEVNVVRSVDPLLDVEAVRLIKSLPKFTPGTNFSGEPIATWYTVPISFRLPDKPVADE